MSERQGEGMMHNERNEQEGATPSGATNGAEAAAMLPGDEVPPGAPASGEHLCRACRGTGHRDNGEPCPECDGTGRVTVAISAGP
ncbi:MAG TPA: hypothetical protein VIL85_00530 [Thermomicrobiales bacterium]|jgi:RecJ-like exonuclease